MLDGGPPLLTTMRPFHSPRSAYLWEPLVATPHCLYHAPECQLIWLSAPGSSVMPQPIRRGGDGEVGILPLHQVSLSGQRLPDQPP